MAASDLRAFGFGVTQIHIGSSGLAEGPIKAPRGCVGGQFKILAGAGTLAIVNSGESMGQGYPVGATEVVSFTGPLGFYLAAKTATMTISMVYAIGAGASLFP